MPKLSSRPPERAQTNPALIAGLEELRRKKRFQVTIQAQGQGSDEIQVEAKSHFEHREQKCPELWRGLFYQNHTESNVATAQSISDPSLQEKILEQPSVPGYDHSQNQRPEILKIKTAIRRRQGSSAIPIVDPNLATGTEETKTKDSSVKTAAVSSRHSRAVIITRPNLLSQNDKRAESSSVKATAKPRHLSSAIPIVDPSLAIGTEKTSQNSSIKTATSSCRHLSALPTDHPKLFADNKRTVQSSSVKTPSFRQSSAIPIVHPSLAIENKKRVQGSGDKTAAILCHHPAAVPVIDPKVVTGSKEKAKASSVRTATVTCRPSSAIPIIDPQTGKRL